MPLLNDYASNVPHNFPHFLNLVECSGKIQVIFINDIEQIPRRIVLHLCIRGISDTDGIRVFITRKMRKNFFFQFTFATNAIHDLKSIVARPQKIPYKTDKSLGHIPMPHIHECTDRHGSIAYPAKSIIPIAAFANRFGETRCQCRNHRPR